MPSDYSDLPPAMGVRALRERVPGLGRDLAYAIAKAVGFKAGKRWLLPRSRVVDFLEGRLQVSGVSGDGAAPEDTNR